MKLIRSQVRERHLRFYSVDVRFSLARDVSFATNFISMLFSGKKNSVADVEAVEEKLPYPKSIFFIISNEFCERFNYYGMRSKFLMEIVESAESTNLKFPRSHSRFVFDAKTTLR